jgi:hypothetical protein
VTLSTAEVAAASASANTAERGAGRDATTGATLRSAGAASGAFEDRIGRIASTVAAAVAFAGATAFGAGVNVSTGGIATGSVALVIVPATASSKLLPIIASCGGPPARLCGTSEDSVANPAACSAIDIAPAQHAMAGPLRLIRGPAR